MCLPASARSACARASRRQLGRCASSRDQPGWQRRGNTTPANSRYASSPSLGEISRFAGLNENGCSPLQVPALARNEGVRGSSPRVGLVLQGLSAGGRVCAHQGEDISPSAATRQASATISPPGAPLCGSSPGVSLPVSSLLQIARRENAVEPLDHLKPLQGGFEVALGGITLDKGQSKLSSLVV
jgi:hypothetical protein